MSGGASSTVRMWADNNQQTVHFYDSSGSDTTVQASYFIGGGLKNLSTSATVFDANNYFILDANNSISLDLSNPGSVISVAMSVPSLSFNGATQIDLTSLQINDASALPSVNYGSRTLIASDGATTVLDWHDPNNGVAITGTVNPVSPSPGSGVVGEYIVASVVVGSAVSLTTATPKTVTSISLGAGKLAGKWKRLHAWFGNGKCFFWSYWTNDKLINWHRSGRHATFHVGPFHIVL